MKHSSSRPSGSMNWWMRRSHSTPVAGDARPTGETGGRADRRIWPRRWSPGELRWPRRRDLARRLATAQEDERRRVARDLHDTVGQLVARLVSGVQGDRDRRRPPPDRRGATGRRPAGDERSESARSTTSPFACGRRRSTTSGWMPARSNSSRVVVPGPECGRTSCALGLERLPGEVETAVYRDRAGGADQRRQARRRRQLLAWW